MDYIIRQAEYKDIEKIIEIYDKTISYQLNYISHGEIQDGIATSQNELSPHRFEIWRESIEKTLESCPSGLLVAERDSQICGFLVASIKESKFSKISIIEDICVDPEHRKKGVFSLLFKKIKLQLQNENVKSIFLESGIENHLFHKIAQEQGFETVSKVFMYKMDK